MGSEAGGRLAGAIGDVVSAAPAMPTCKLQRRAGFGTCELEDAMFMIITEEGVGNCFYYAYERQADAESYFGVATWLPISRLLFMYNGRQTDREAPALEELRKGGPPMAHNTIRRAAQALAVLASPATVVEESLE